MNESLQNVKQHFENNTNLREATKVDLRNFIQSNAILPVWEENFWLAKYVDEYENHDAKYDRYIASLYEEALSKGLTYRSNEQYFFDASLVIAKHHFKYQKYQLAENSLLLIRELNHNKKSLPNWVFQYSAITFYKLNLKYIISHSQEFYDAIDDIDDTNLIDRKQKVYLLRDFISSVSDYNEDNPKEVEKIKYFENEFYSHIMEYKDEIARSDISNLNLEDDSTQLTDLGSAISTTNQYNRDAEILTLRNLLDSLQSQNDQLSERLEKSQSEYRNLYDIQESSKICLQNQLDNYMKELENIQRTFSTSTDEIGDLKTRLLNETKVNAELKGQVLNLETISDTQQENIEQLTRSVEDRDLLIDKLKEEVSVLRIFREQNKPVILQTDDINGSTDYSVRKRDFKILVLGGSQINADDIYHIAKRHSIAKNQLDLKIDYDKITNFNIDSIRYQSMYSAILIGPVPHSVKNKGESTSIVTKMSNEEGYPLNMAMYTESGELKITRRSFEKALTRILDQLKSVGVA